MPQQVPCPTCGRPVDWDTKQTYRPFCSKRCRLIDLGEWLDENRRIGDDETDSDGLPWSEPNKSEK